MFIENKYKKIEENIWIETVNSNVNILSLKKSEGLDFDLYDYALIEIGNKIYGRLLWNWDKGKVDLEFKMKDLHIIYKVLLKIADQLGGEFYYKSNVLFDPLKHLPIPSVEINQNVQYFDNHELDYIRWMAIRANDKDSIFKELNLKESHEIFIKEGIDSQSLVITEPFQGWIFIIGDLIPNLLLNGNEQSTDEALTSLCKSLQKLSKSFVEVQYYEHEGKSNINGYFKANNGKLSFGYWESETQKFKKGRLPKEIKNIHPSNAHEVASIWSVDPLDFVYIEQFANEECTIIVAT